MEIIKLENICVESDSKSILKNYNLLVQEKEKIHIVGKSGIGKSTIFRVLLGFQEYHGGFLYYKGSLLDKKDLPDFRNRVAYVNQSPVFRLGKVRDVLEDYKTFRNNDLKNIDDSLFKLFEFDKDLLNNHTTELSGGEKQRLAIMLALSLKRDIYFLDEITSALDNDLKRKVIKYFEDLDATVILISHDNDWSSSTFKEVSF